jgi:glutathione synthase/RimK-type ligase-like ATP-grasp enzyme
MIYIMPYKLGSESAKQLANSLNVLRIGGAKRLARHDTVINWGNNRVVPFSKWGPTRVINTKESIIKASNKIVTFIELTKAGLITVPWTTTASYANEWLSTHDVMSRQYVSSHQGKGIVISHKGRTLITAPLYTKYIAKAHEYRVHVSFGKVIDYTKKRRRNDVPTNSYIKNYNNGWVYCRESAVLPPMIETACIKAIATLGLDFGAVDVLYREMDNKYYILEVNTAPGITGTTLERYTNSFKERGLYAY